MPPWLVPLDARRIMASLAPRGIMLSALIALGSKNVSKSYTRSWRKKARLRSIFGTGHRRAPYAERLTGPGDVVNAQNLRSLGGSGY